MYDMPEREEPQAPEKKPPKRERTERPHTAACRLCERYPGGPATGWHSIETTRMVSTGRPKPNHQTSVAIGSATHCTCALGRWMAASPEAQKVAQHLAIDNAVRRRELGAA